MYLQFMIIKLAKHLLSQCCGFLNKIKRILPSLGNGTLQCWKTNGKKYYYYNTTYNGKRTRVHIDPEWDGADPLIKRLTLKAIALKARGMMKNNIIALSSLLEYYKPYDPISLCRSLPDAYDPDNVDIGEAFMNDDIDPAAWRSERYTKNPYYREHLTHSTKSGEKVRSKSEAIIYEALTEREVDFRYECAVTVNTLDDDGDIASQRTVYPDFMILRKEDRHLILYEHLGRLDDPDYTQKAARKIEDYINTGYYPGINLILTWETRNTPFTAVKANTILDKYLKPADDFS